MDTKGKVLIAIGLVALWGALAYWQWRGLPGQARAPLVNVSGPASSLVRQNAQAGGLRVHLEQLASARTQREATFATSRNIFAAPGSAGALPVAGERQSDQVTDEALRQQAASLELDQYRYLGFVRMGESANEVGNTAVLSKNDDVVIGRVGQRLERHLVVKAITPESVTLRDLQARVDHTVPITENAAEPQP